MEMLEPNMHWGKGTCNKGLCLLKIEQILITSSCNVLSLTDILCWQIIFNYKSLETKTVQTSCTKTEVCSQAHQHNTHGVVDIDSFGNER